MVHAKIDSMGQKNRKTVEKSVNRNFCKKAELMVKYSKRHNKFLFPALAEAIYGSSCKAENEISNVVNYRFTEKKEAVPYESS